MQSAVYTEQIRLLYKNLPVSLLGSGSVGFAITALLLPSVDTGPIAAWCAVLIVMLIWRTAAYFQFKKISLTDELARRLGRHTIIYSLGFGVLWAWLPAFYIAPDDLLIISNIGLFLVGVVAGALVTQAVFMPSLYAFLIPVALSSTTAMAVNAGSYSYLAIIGAVYVVIAFAFAKRVHDMFIDTIKIRFENDELMQQLRREKRQAEEANLAKSQFLASASHDVRQPLHAMSLYVSMLKDDPGNTQIVERLIDSLEALEGLYSRILEISQLDAGAIEVQLEPVPLAKICTQTVDRYQAVAADKGLSLEQQIDPDIWVMSDAILLGRVIDNLIANALRYTETGGVRLFTSSAPDRIALAVQDTGVGIAEDQLAHIFREFYQVDNPERDRNKGMGLGLSIVSRLSDLLGHEIAVQSQPAQGSTFTLTMASCSPNAQAEGIQSNTLPLGAFNALLVEDDQQAQQALALTVASWGGSVQTIRSVLEIDEAATRPDIVIADYRLPGDCNGLELLQLINKRFGQHLPGILVTGDTAPAVLKRLRDSGYPVMHKPVNAALLQRTVYELLREADSTSKIPRA